MGRRTTFTRREVLTLGTGLLASSAVLGKISAPRTTRFGMIADVHHGLALDTEQRLSDFIEAASARELDFIVQLGDFNHPVRAARGFLNIWSDYRGPRYGVLGNHDMDLGTKQDAIDLWQIPGRYYSFDAGHLHFVVLDANHIYQDRRFVPYENSNYYLDGRIISHIDDEQFSWFAKDLQSTDRQTVVFIHQPIDEIWMGGSCQNRHRARAIIEEANRRVGWQKVIACFQGHHHEDKHQELRNVHYFRVNSSSYNWVGGDYGRMAHYDRSLYSFVTLTEDGQIIVEGRHGEWIPPSPSERGVPNSDRLSPSIEDRRLHFSPKPLRIL